MISKIGVKIARISKIGTAVGAVTKARAALIGSESLEFIVCAIPAKKNDIKKRTDGIKITANAVFLIIRIKHLTVLVFTPFSKLYLSIAPLK